MVSLIGLAVWAEFSGRWQRKSVWKRVKYVSFLRTWVAREEGTWSSSRVFGADELLKGSSPLFCRMHRTNTSLRSMAFPLRYERFVHRVRGSSCYSPDTQIHTLKTLPIHIKATFLLHHVKGKNVSTKHMPQTNTVSYTNTPPTQARAGIRGEVHHTTGISFPPPPPKKNPPPNRKGRQRCDVPKNYTTSRTRSTIKLPEYSATSSLSSFWWIDMWLFKTSHFTTETSGEHRTRSTQDECSCHGCETWHPKAYVKTALERRMTPNVWLAQRPHRRVPKHRRQARAALSSVYIMYLCTH